MVCARFAISGRTITSHHQSPLLNATTKCRHRLVPVGCARGLICSAPRNSLPIAMRCRRLQPILHSEQSSCRHTFSLTPAHAVMDTSSASLPRFRAAAPSIRARPLKKRPMPHSRIFGGPRTYDLACRFFKSAAIRRGPAPGERPFFQGPCHDGSQYGLMGARPSALFIFHRRYVIMAPLCRTGLKALAAPCGPTDALRHHRS